MSEREYWGEELHLFAAVRKWKRYWSQAIREYVSGDILEVGAGTGSNTEFLISEKVGRCVCLEPDQRLLDRLRQRLETTGNRSYEAICGTLRTIDRAWRFDTIVYIDVLEHIQDDREELKLAATYLRRGGHAIVVSPAHQWLFSPFDAALGHFRRYNRKMLQSITPPELGVERLMYLDSVGILTSAANRLLLHQAIPTEAQIQFWDRRIIPVSRAFDGLLHNSVGKSIIGVWRKAAESGADGQS